MRASGSKSISSVPITMALMSMPTRSITYKSATTRGRFSSVARSVANARPAVWVVCIPAPTRRKAKALAAMPRPTGAPESPDITSSANGMMASPPNCISEPNQMNGTRRQPSAETWVSDLNPIRARSGANTSGKATISATSAAGMPSSAIITRLSVPVSRTAAMPTDTWNSDRRRSWLSGSSLVATSAKGSMEIPSSAQRRARDADSRFMPAPAPSPERCRRSCRCAWSARSASP